MVLFCDLLFKYTKLVDTLFKILLDGTLMLVIPLGYGLTGLDKLFPGKRGVFLTVQIDRFLWGGHLLRNKGGSKGACVGA